MGFYPDIHEAIRQGDKRMKRERLKTLILHGTNGVEQRFVGLHYKWDYISQHPEVYQKEWVKARKQMTKAMRNYKGEYCVRT